MTTHPSLLSTALVVWACACVWPVSAQPAASAPVATTAEAKKFVEVLATIDTLKQIKAGGYTLYLRHGPTDNTRPDRYPQVDLNDCNTQRPLTEEGRQLVAKVGQAMAQARIPIAEIRISPMCRVKDSAAAAFPKQTALLDPNLMYTANLTKDQKAPILANTRQWLSAPPETGSNRLLIAHGPNLMDLIGYFPKEATLVVFRPAGEAGFEYVASFPPTRWAELSH